MRDGRDHPLCQINITTSTLKHLIRKWMFTLGIDLTKNQKMDRMTYKIIRNHLTSYANCIDVGCHKGEVLEWFLRFAPDGTHIGFEPIPQLFEKLKIRFSDTSCVFYNYALSDEEGQTEFVYVPEAPAYSGLKERDYDGKNVHPQKIPVTMKRLDDLVLANTPVALIKIDVEGGELGVLQGAKELLKRDKPLVIFEHGKGASDRYGTTPEMILKVFLEAEMNVYTLPSYINQKKPLTVEQFQHEFDLGENYYFVAK